MTRSTAVPRLALWKVALGPVAAAAALLAFTGAANAAVINVSPGNTVGATGAPTRDNLSNAIITANGNGAASNTIVLAPGKYQPQSCASSPCTTAPAVYPTITSNLTITGDHSLQATGQASTLIDGSLQASSAAGNMLSTTSAGSLTLEAIEIDSGGGTGFSVISDGGKLTTWGVLVSGSPGAGIGVLSGASATLNETTLAAPAQNAINNAGSLTLNNSTVAQGAAIGIANNAPGTFAMTNTVMAFQTGVECNGGSASNGGPGSFSDDATCGVAHLNDTTLDNAAPGGFNGLNPTFNGGPTATYKLSGGSTANAGVTPCPTTDQRFFVQTTSCDAGALTQSATRNTTGPTCSVSTNLAGTPATQTVTVTDSGSGLGPESGTAYDPNSQTSPQPQNPRAQASVPSDAFSGLGITNGTVAISTLPTAPSRSAITLTASKTTAGTATQWWFTATDWAGNVRFFQSCP